MNLVVLLCTYNGEKYINKQLESLEAQKLKPDLIYIYDWGSTDGTVEHINEFRSNTSLTCKLVQKENPIGVAAGFKFAIKDILECNDSFDYIAMCDQDDIWLPEKLSEYRDSLELQPHTDIVFSDVSLIDGSGLVTLKSRNKSSMYFTNELFDFDDGVIFANPVVGMTMLVSRRLCDVYSNIEFDDEIMHDWAIVMLCRILGFESIYIDKPLVLYRQHANNVLGNKSNNSKLSILMSMSKRVDRLIVRHDNFTSKLGLVGKPGNLDLVSSVRKSKLLSPIYKFVLCFFIILRNIFG